MITNKRELRRTRTTQPEELYVSRTFLRVGCGFGYWRDFDLKQLPVAQVPEGC
jgi:hypothetical protein